MAEFAKKTCFFRQFSVSMLVTTTHSQFDLCVNTFIATAARNILFTLSRTKWPTTTTFISWNIGIWISWVNDLKKLETNHYKDLFPQMTIFRILVNQIHIHQETDWYLQVIDGFWNQVVDWHKNQSIVGHDRHWLWSPEITEVGKHGCVCCDGAI